MRILIIIPAYNEALNIERVVENIIHNYPQYDYVVVNDGSKDSTADICRKNKYNLIDLPINLGLSGAVQAGMRYAVKMNYDAAVQFDGDGQHRAEYIAMLAKELTDNSAKIVIGSRFLVEQKQKQLTGITFFIRDNIHGREQLSDIKSALLSLKQQEKEFDLGTLEVTMKNIKLKQIAK